MATNKRKPKPTEGQTSIKTYKPFKIEVRLYNDGILTVVVKDLTDTRNRKAEILEAIKNEIEKL